MPEGIEKRKFKRFPLERIIVYDMKREKYLDARGIDVSRGGIGFFSREFVKQDTPVWLSFYIPRKEGGTKQLETEGEIVNVVDTPDGTRFGITFARMLAEDKILLDNFLSELEEK